jgi:hypothetical protein
MINGTSWTVGRASGVLVANHRLSPRASDVVVGVVGYSNPYVMTRVFVLLSAAWRFIGNGLPMMR